MRIAKADRLGYWQDTLKNAEKAYSPVLEKMDGREALYRGEAHLRPIVDLHEYDAEPRHVWNIVAENIESEIDTNIPQPKVTPRRKEDEDRAKLIEDLIRGELDRMPMEELNDLMERMVPIQGGGFWLVEWDDTLGSYYRTGENVVSVLHPKTVIPQDGVFSGIDDMDYVILKQPETKSYVKRRWGIDVTSEGEEEPDIRSYTGEGQSDDLVTVYTVYYRSDDSRINKFTWCNNTVIEDIEDYQARRHRRCKDCGALLPYDEDRIREMLPPQTANSGANEAIALSMYQLGVDVGKIDPEEPVPVEAPKEEKTKIACPYCGGTKLSVTIDDNEEIIKEFTTSRGLHVPGGKPGVGKDGKPVVSPTLIPSYKPDVFPVIMQRNISVYGQLLGDSDADKIADQQNALNWYLRKIDDRLLGAGSVIALPKDSSIDIDPDDNRVWRVDKVQDLSMIRTIDFESDLTSHFRQLTQSYEAARNILGITDSFQGRRDTTATSGKAKEFAAAQSAGRLESKRRLKQAAWARLFELIFKFTLAYAEEPRQIATYDANGDAVYKTFDRWDFLDRDPKTGEFYWDDDFLFSCDSSAPLASNREAMWQECREMLLAGAYGNPGEPDSLILFWTEMERLHYPLAAAAKARFRKAQEQQLAMQQQMLQMQGGMQAMPQIPEGTGGMPTQRTATITAPNGQIIQ